MQFHEYDVLAFAALCGTENCFCINFFLFGIPAQASGVTGTNVLFLTLKILKNQIVQYTK